MKRLALARLALLFFLSPPVFALEQSLEVIVSGTGESEAAVCDRANRKAIDDAVRLLGESLSDDRRFHRLLDDYRFAGRDRGALERDVKTSVAEHLQYFPVEQFWSGRSCLVRGLAEVEESEVFSDIEASLPERTQSPDPAGGEGWLESIPGYSSVMMASEMSSALAEVTPIKIYVAEYYMQYGQWPESLTEMGVDPAEFRLAQYIEQVSLDEGAVRAMLKGRLAGEWILLTPSAGAFGAINWDCRVSVSARLGPCEGP